MLDAALNVAGSLLLLAGLYAWHEANPERRVA